MIGKLIIIKTPFFDRKIGKDSFKKRPALAIAKADTEDYVVLPISTIKEKRYKDATYDIEITPEKYPKLNLRETSYIRTHKQSIINIHDIANEKYLPIDLKSLYEDLYLEVLDKREMFNQSINNQALK